MRGADQVNPWRGPAMPQDQYSLVNSLTPASTLHNGWNEESRREAQGKCCGPKPCACANDCRHISAISWASGACPHLPRLRQVKQHETFGRLSWRFESDAVARRGCPLQPSSCARRLAATPCRRTTSCLPELAAAARGPPWWTSATQSCRARTATVSSGSCSGTGEPQCCCCSLQR